MIITRKIEIRVHEQDTEQKKQYMQTLYDWRDAVRRAANLIVSHRFVQQNVREFMYLQDDVLERLDINNKPFVYKDKKTDGFKLAYKDSKDILKDEKGLSEQNVTYRLISSFLKNKVNSDIYTCLNQLVASSYKETAGNIAVGESSLRSYKNNIPIPFSARALSNLHKAEEEYTDTNTGEVKKVNRYYFNLFGIPFCCHLGQDRSNNESILQRCIDGELKVCSSSIAFEKKFDKKSEKKKQKLFLFLCVDIPVQKVALNSNKVLYAYLGINHPIVFCVNVVAKNVYDSGVKFFHIGTKEEFLYRRTQIQAAVQRCQANNKYAKGGHGRKRKCQAIERWHDKENNYVDTKLHTYSRELINLAIKHKCGKIVLVNQKEREDQAKEAHEKGDGLVLRNWSYFGLKTKIKYKADAVGIEVKELKESEIKDKTK